MNDQPITYKVCQLIDGDMYSAWLGNTFFGLRYQLNEWTTPKVGGILCFSTLDEATQYVQNIYSTRLRIFRCLGDKPIELPKCSLNISVFLRFKETDLFYLKQIWKHGYINPSWLEGGWPTGTIAYSRVKPLEIVK